MNMFLFSLPVNTYLTHFTICVQMPAQLDAKIITDSFHPCLNISSDVFVFFIISDWTNNKNAYFT